MPNVKQLIADTGGATGLTLFFKVRFQDGKMLDNVDGVFRAAPVNPLVPALEITVANGFLSTMLGWYELDESRTVWADGIYTFELVTLLGLQYAGGASEEIYNDDVITGKSVKAQTDLVVSGGATEANVNTRALEDGGRLQTVDALTATNLDATVGSRATPGDVTASEGVVTGAITTSEGIITGAITSALNVIKDQLASLWKFLLGRK